MSNINIEIELVMETIAHHNRNISELAICGLQGSQEYSLACQYREKAVERLDLLQRQKRAWEQDRMNN